MKRKKHLILYFIFFVLLYSFTINYKYKNEEPLTFEKDIKPIMNTYCGGIFCHHGKPSVWTNYKITKIAVDSGTFYTEVIENKTMPKRRKFPQEKYDLIKKWLKEGAKEK